MAMDLASLFGLSSAGLGGMQAAAGAPAYNPFPDSGGDQANTGYVPLQGGATITDPFNQAVIHNNLAAGFNQAAMGGQTGVNRFMQGMSGQTLQLPTAAGYNPAATGATGTGGAPTYNNSNGLAPALKTTLSAANAGSITQGLGAFIGNPYEGGGYNPGDAYIAGANMDPTYADRTRAFANAYGTDTSGLANTNTNNQTLENALNNKLSNYYSISGLSGGWDGSQGNPRSAATTMYQDVGNGQLAPVQDPYRFTAPTTGSINRENNMKTLTALSMMMPAFGGAAGMLGAGAEGTLSAGSGLGLTNAAAGAIGTGATNALVNAGTNYALSGGQGGLQGIGSSLLGSGLSAAGNSILGNTNGLGQMFDTGGASALGSTYNPMSGFNQMMGTTGVAPQLGGAANFLSALGGGGVNGSTIGQAGAGLAGNYLARQIDPRLAGLGSTAGRNLASLYYR